jgi:hypothetical protein
VVVYGIRGERPVLAKDLCFHLISCCACVFVCSSLSSSRLTVHRAIYIQVFLQFCVVRL